LLLAGAAVLALGWILGHPVKLFLAAVALYSGWHLAHLLRLCLWLPHPEREPPRSSGLWADIFNSISEMEQRNRLQQSRYLSMIDDFRNVTDAFPDATLIINEDCRLTWFNKAAGLLLGLDGQDEIGRPIKNLIRNSDFQDWLNLQVEEPCRLEMTISGNDARWSDVASVSIREDQRLIILRDISEVHNVEQIRRDFVTNISHELRTPLTVMRGYLELLQDRPEDEMTVAFRRMHKQAIQMQSMLDDLLELSRLQDVDTSQHEEPVDIPAMLIQVREQAEEISRGKHELQFDLEDGLALSGVKSDLESAFRNLIVNALKYTPEGGSVSVTWEDTPDGPVLTVKDSGIGIPKREIPRLTERFYRVGSDRGRESGGTGLGLAIVKHVLNGHQASLVIESEYGVGSRFSCVFPPERKRC
jgi:two-component system phosphate regulon sensor histidine kinase PhoR